MSKSEKRKLIRAFEVAFELAYRRGFHHGFVAREENPKMTEAQIATWRSGPVRTTMTPPPGRGGWQGRIIDRMVFECRGHGDVIRAFLRAEPAMPSEY